MSFVSDSTGSFELASVSIFTLQIPPKSNLFVVSVKVSGTQPAGGRLPQKFADFLLRMCLNFYSVLDSAVTDQPFFLTLVDLFLLLLWPVPLHRLIYFTFKTSGLSDAEAARLFLFKLLLLPLVPVLAASPNGPDESG